MIISNTSELQKYIPVNDTFAFKPFEPYINKAINTYTRKYVGKLHVELAQTESAADSIKNEAREHLCSAIANFAFFIYQPFFQLQMDGSGMSVVENQNRKQPEWWQMADAKRELLRSGHESMDFLLEILEKNPTDFPEFTENYSTLYTELLVRNAEDFNSCYTIFNSRQTYLALVPTIRQVETQLFKNFITPDFYKELRELNISGSDSTTPDDENKLQIKKYLQQAVVCFTIARIYNEGMFNVDASGIKLKFDTLPNEKVQAVDYGKPSDQLQRSIKANIDNGTQFILLAKEQIADLFSNGLISKSSTITSTIGEGGVIGI